MASPKGSKAYTRKVPAGEERTITKGGEFFYVLECDQAEFAIGMDDSALDYAKLRTNKRVEQGAQFSSLRIHNPGLTDLNVRIIIGFGEYGDDEVNIGGSVTAAITKNATVADAPDVALVAATATKIVSTDSTRRGVMISNDTGAAIRVGGASVAAARGVKIAADAVATVESSGEVWGYSAAGGTVSIVEVKD